MAQQQVTLTITAKDDGTVLAVTQGLDKLFKAAERAGSTASKPIAPKVDPSGVINLKDHFSSLTFGMQKFARVYVSLQVIMATVATVLAVRHIVEAADAWAMMSARLRLVSGSAGEAAVAQKQLFALAQEMSMPLASVAELYTRIAFVTRELGLAQKDVLNLTRVVSGAMQLSGSSAQEAASGVRQFTQALARYKLRGDELVSLLENQPRLITAIDAGLRLVSPEYVNFAKSAQTAAGAVLTFALAGKASGDLLIRALGTQTEAIAKEMAQLPDTVEKATTRLQNSFLRLGGGLTTKPLTSAIEELRLLLEEPIEGEGLRRALQGLLDLSGDFVRQVPAVVTVLQTLLDVLTVPLATVLIVLSSAAGAIKQLVTVLGTFASMIERLAHLDYKGAGTAMVKGLKEWNQNIVDFGKSVAESGTMAEGGIKRLFGIEDPALAIQLETLELKARKAKKELEQLDAAKKGLKASASSPEDIKKEVDAILKLAEATATLAREQAELWEARGIINHEMRINLEIGALEELDRVQTKQLKTLKGMPLEYAQLQTANIKTQQDVVELTAKLNTMTNSFQMSSLGMQALKENVQAGLFHGPVEETERLAKNISLLNPSETPKLLQPSLWNALKTSIMGVGSSMLSVDDATAKLIETYQDPSIDKMLATERKIADTQIERIDLLEKLNKVSGFDASAQKLAIMEKQLQNLEATKASYAGIVDENSALAIEILKVKAGIQQLQDESNAFRQIWDGITDIISVFGIKVGKFVLILQQLPRALGGISKIFSGITGLAGLMGITVGATIPGTAAAAVETLGKAAGISGKSLSGLTGVVGLVERALMLFTNGLMGIFSFFSQIVQGIASGGGIISTITSAFSGLVSSGGMLATVFGGISTVGGSIMNAFQGVGGLAEVFQSVFNAVGLGMSSSGFGTGAAVAGGTPGLTGGAGSFATFLGKWVPVAGALYALATTIQDFFAGRLEKAIGATIGTAIGAYVGSIVPGLGTITGAVIGNFIGGFIGGLFAPTPKIKLSAGIAPFDRNAMGSAIDTTVPGTQVGAGIVNISGNIMKNKKERALQELLATMINEMLITVVDATVLMIKTLPPAIGAQLDQALTNLEATGLEIVDKKWKGGKAGKKFNKRVKGLMEETLQDLVTALDFGDVDLKALGFDPNDKKGKKGGEVARGFEAMMMALGGLSAIVKEVGPAVDLSGVSLAQFTKGAIDLFKGFAKEGEAFKDTITRVMQAFGEIIALKDQLRSALSAMSGDLTEVVALVTRQLEAIEANMVSMVDALTVAIESGGTPEEVLAAAKAATQAVIEGLKMQIEAVTALHDAVLKLNSAITSGVDLIVDLTQQINALRGQELSAADFEFGLDGLVALWNQLTDVTSRIALFSSGLRGMAGNLTLFTENIPLAVQGFNIIMGQIRDMANPQEAVTALQSLAGAVNAGLQALVASVQRQTQARIAGLEAEKSAIQANFDAQRTALEAQRDLIAANFDAQRTALEAQRDLITETYDAKRDALQTQLNLAQEWGNVLQSVKAQLVDLFNLLAPTHPQTSLNEVQSQFNAAFAAFKANPSTEAAARVQELARQLLQLAQQTPGYDLPSAKFQELAGVVRSALEGIQAFAKAQPTEEAIRAKLAALEVEQAASLKAIDARIAALSTEEAVALAAIDARIAALSAGEAAALARIDQQIASANADGLAQIQYFQELAAQGLEAIRAQLVIEVTELAVQQAIAAAALQAVIGDKSFEQFIAEKQAEAADLLRGIDRTLQEYLGSIITGLGFGVPAMASGGYVPASPGGTLVRLGEGGRGEWVVPEGRSGNSSKTEIIFSPQITITGTVNARKMADEIEDALVEKMQTGSRLRQATKALVGGRG